MSKKDLTIIIPFINERYELEETLKNIREYSDNNVDIIVINDASDDNFDYKSVAKQYEAIYTENKERIGVAASRDIGVKACSTSYFFLLDAHMRFYNKLWVERIIEELQTDPKTLLCCQTKVLKRINGLLAEDLTRGYSYGACVVLDDALCLFEPKWVKDDPCESSVKTIPIPCVLGAGYACNKEYWQYLRGLEGLMQYGNDEAYISMKTWMAGGSCKLAKDIEIGHVYRSSHPYSRSNEYRFYNSLFLSEIFLSLRERKKHLSTLKLFYDKKVLGEAQYKLYDNRKLIENLKKYYKEILINNITFFRGINDKYLPVKKLVDSKEEILLNLVERITHNIPENIGLINGQMGIIIFFYHYASFSENKNYIELSDKMLKNLLKNIKSDMSYCFISGLCGIGWGVEYLYQNGFIDTDTSKMLAYIDKKVMEIDPFRCENIDRDYGLGGIVLYLLARLYTIHNQNLENPFDDSYLSNVHKKVKSIIDQRNTESNSIDIYQTFLLYYDNNNSIEKAVIYDACSLFNMKNVLIPDLEPGLRGGLAGVGLTLILEECGQ